MQHPKTASGLSAMLRPLAVNCWDWTETIAELNPPLTVFSMA